MMELEELQMRNDWEASAYWDDTERKFYLPDTVLLACIRTGAAATKKGKDIDRAVRVSETEAWIETKSFKNLEDAYKDKAFRLEGPCKIPPKTGALIWKCRCMIPTGWKMTFSLDYDEMLFPGESLRKVLSAAGENGVGGWRPMFGRFIVEIL